MDLRAPVGSSFDILFAQGFGALIGTALGGFMFGHVHTSLLKISIGVSSGANLGSCLIPYLLIL